MRAKRQPFRGLEFWNTLTFTAFHEKRTVTQLFFHNDFVSKLELASHVSIFCDQEISSSELIVSIFIFSQYFFNVFFAQWKMWSCATKHFFRKDRLLVLFKFKNSISLIPVRFKRKNLCYFIPINQNCIHGTLSLKNQKGVTEILMNLTHLGSHLRITP